MLSRILMITSSCTRRCSENLQNALGVWCLRRHGGLPYWGKAAVEVEPGPLAVEFCVRNIKDSSTREFVVPAGGGSLGSLLAASLDYEPVVVTRLQELIDSAGDAAERLSGAALSSAEKADSSAKAARRFEDAASKYAAAAKVSQDAAKGSEDVAAQSASAADVSAKAAKASEDAAAGSASSAKRLESNAAAFKDAADSSASDAATSAGNAKSRSLRRKRHRNGPRKSPRAPRGMVTSSP